jgi:hypothetical protein
LVSDVESISVERNLDGNPDRYTPSCRAMSGTSDLVIVWKPAEAGTYIIDTLGSEIDTVLAVYAGECGGTEIACNDEDQHLSHQSRVVVELDALTYITLVVDGYQGQTGKVLLNASRADAMVDKFVRTLDFANTRENTDARMDHFTSSCNSKISSPDYVFSFKAEVAATYRFSVSSSEFKPVISLRDGGPAGNEIACNGDFNPSIEYALNAGRSVAVVVDGYQGGSGEFLARFETNVDDSGSCAVASEWRTGCMDPDVTACVCQQLSECCLGPWNALCAGSDLSLACGTASH